MSETPPRQSDRAARLFTAASRYLNTPPDARKNWGQINPNINHYHSDPIEISSTFSIPGITGRWRLPEDLHSQSADPWNVARKRFPILPHHVRVEASFTLGRDVIGWGQSNCTGKTLREKVVARQFARANDRMLAGDDPALDTLNTENDSKMKKVAEERKLYRMAKVHDFLEMWQGRHNLGATKNKPCAKNKQMASGAYSSDMKEIVQASRSLFQHDGAAAFKLSERSPLPPALYLPERRTQILNVHQDRRLNRHPVQSDEDCAPECISHIYNWLNLNGDLANPNDSEDNCSADDEADIEQGNGIEDPEYPWLWDVSVATNVTGFTRPTLMWKRQAEKVLVTVNAIERRSNTGVKKK